MKGVKKERGKEGRKKEDKNGRKKEGNKTAFLFRSSSKLLVRRERKNKGRKYRKE